MNLQEYVEVALGRPAMMSWKADPGEKQKALEGAFANAIRKICLTYDFPFMLGEAEATSVADQGVYVLSGDDGDCRDIISVSYDSALLEERSYRWYLEQVAGVASSDSYNAVDDTPAYWIQIGEASGNPVVRIYPTPSSAGDTIAYRFRRKVPSFEAFPDSWSHVMIAVMEADLFGSAGVASMVNEVRSANPQLFVINAEKAISEMVDHYHGSTGGPSEVPLDPTWRAENRRRNALFGY